MENSVCKQPQPYPWLLLLREGQDGRNHQIFLNIDELDPDTIDVFSCGCQGWLLIVEYHHQCFLWNALTLESIQLPSLGSEGTVRHCRLSSPPCNPESLILIFFLNGSSFKFCRVGDQHWSEQSVTDSSSGDDDVSASASLMSPVCCNGKLYAIAANMKDKGDQLLEIDLNLIDGHCAVHLHDSLPSCKDHSAIHIFYMVESCGEMFMVYIIRGGKSLIEVTGVEVYKLDVSLMEWTQVKSAEDRVFFLDEMSGYSYQTPNPETEGNRVYFTLFDRKVYAFHIEENSVATSLPYPDLKSPWRARIWIMAPTCSNSRLITSPNTVQDDAELEINHQHTKDTFQGDEDEEAKKTDNLCHILPDMLWNIARWLPKYDYINVRLLNRTFRSVVPPIWGEECRLVAPPIWGKELERDSIPPMLVFCKRGQDKCKFTDPLQQASYLRNNPDKSSEVRICYSKQGWCLMVQDKFNPTLFLWNPFENKIIPLPSSPYTNPESGSNFDQIVCCEFLSSPDSSDCVIAVVYDFWGNKHLDHVDVNQGTWERRIVLELDVSYWNIHNILVLCNGNRCVLDPKGNLTVFKPDDSPLKVKRPCLSFYQSFMLEANGKLLAVFLGFMGEWLRVFEMDLSRSKPLWNEVDNVGDKTLYVSRRSSFATAARTEELKNTIYLPRFYGNKLIYYSLSTRKYHCYDSNVVLEDFYNTKEQLYSSWI